MTLAIGGMLNRNQSINLSLSLSVSVSLSLSLTTFNFVLAYNRCEVACQARVYRFYTGFGLPVKDGLPCDSEPDSNDVIKTRSVCLQGVCKVSF